MINALVPFLRTAEHATGATGISLCKYAADEIEAQSARIVSLETKIAALEAELASGSFYKESDIDAMQGRILTLEALVRRAQAIIDPCYPQRSLDWQNDARAAVGAGQ